jgi:hypothetical protein
LLSISFPKESLGPFGEATQFAPSEALAALRQHFRSRRNPFTNTLLTMSNRINMCGFGLKMMAGIAIAGTATISHGPISNGVRLRS